MKRGFSVGLFLGLILCIGVPAFAAGIDNTHHSMKDYLATGTKFTCFACHGYAETATASVGLGDVGTFCYNRCHKGSGSFIGAGAAITPGVVGAFTYPDNTILKSSAALSGQDALRYGHGYSWASLPGKDLTPTANTAGWPYMTGTMQCTTCHDVHNNTYAPFLRAPLSTAANSKETTSTTVPLTFCVRCHTGGTNGLNRYVEITANPNGSHVIEVDNVLSATRAADSGTNGGGKRHNRRIVFKSDNVFDTPTSWGTDLKGLADAGKWNLGGKRGGNPQKNVSCYTCHQVHMSVSLLPPTGQKYTALTSMAYSDNNAHTAAGDDLCHGCHGNTSQIANPGTTAYYHPVGTETVNTSISTPAAAIYTVSTGDFSITVNMAGKGYGPNGRLLCTSCHAPAHAGAANSMVLNNATPNCQSCHGAASTQTGTNLHHVTGTVDYTTAQYGSYKNPTWGPASATQGAMGEMSDGLGCQDCHSFNSTAHNWN